MSKLQYSSYDDMLKALRCEVIEPFKKAMADKGLRFDKDYRNCDGENVYFVTESGVTIRVAFDGRATSDSRWDHTYQQMFGRLMRGPAPEQVEVEEVEVPTKPKRTRKAPRGN